MISNVDKTLQAVGDKHRYQYTLLLIGFMLWICLDLVSISLPYLEKRSLVRKLDDTSHIFKNFSLTYEMCKNLDYKKNIVEQSGHSLVIFFNIECDSFKTGLLGSSAFFGVLIGSFLLQYLPDNIGRKTTALIGSVAFSFLSLAFTQVKSFYIAIILILFLQAFAYLGLLSIFMILNEVSAPSHRPVFGAIVNSAFSFSGIFFILLYKNFDSWTLNFQIASIYSLFVSLFLYLIIIESPRYYVLQKDEEGFKEVIQYISRFNSKENKLIFQKNEKENNQTETSTDEESQLNNFEICDNNKESTSSSSSSLLLFNKDIKITFIIMCYIWFSTSGIYYGFSIYLKNLPGDIYINGLSTYTYEIFSYIITAWIVNVEFFGRKGSMLLFLSLSFLGYLGILCFDKFTLILSFISRFAISGVYNIIYTYSTEVYPTVIRAKGFGMNSICARLGGILFPILIELFDSSVIYIFLILNFLALIAVTYLPETYNKPLQDEIENNSKQ
jgi:MFS family permease